VLEPKKEVPVSLGHFIELMESIRPAMKTLRTFRRKILIENAFVLVIDLVLLLFVVPPYFSTVVTILPDYGNKSPGLEGLSALASTLSSAGLSGGASPTQIYENILLSDGVIRPVIYAKYKTNSFKDSVNLLQYFNVTPDEDEPPVRRDLKMYKTLYKTFTKSNLQTNVDGITNILIATVTMPESKLSADVANNIASSLDEYVRSQKKSYASNQRFYIEKRMGQVKDSLDHAEKALEKFQIENRVVEQSANLMLVQARLTRSVNILSGVYTQLANQIELVKLQEIKDTPVLNIREEVLDPVLKTGPPRVLITLAVMVVSLIASIIYYLKRDMVLEALRVIRNIVIDRPAT
jgi:uncharacterized protein involved in exopolysaccharide biosynthesis